MQIFKAYKAMTLALLLATSVPAFGSTPWGADYFPNVPLTTHEGETVHFFDDLIKDKVVAINFIYTYCPDTCPLETARLAKVQRLLGERVGKDIFMYSITIDPENDTPEVLAEYAERYNAQPGWWFLTGKEDDITLLRKKLGLYIQEIQDGSNNHNVSLIIGNQTTGKWLKRSPFENPYVLTEQIQNWLTDWKGASKIEFDYAEAPEVRNISQGEYLFRTRCQTCHTIGNGEDGLAPGLEGPDLLGVTKRRDREWLERWLAEPDKMLEEGDPIALGLFAKYNEVPMPNMRLSPIDVKDLLDYMGSESRRVQMQRARERRHAARQARDGVVLASASSTSASQTTTALASAPVPSAHDGHSDAMPHSGDAHTGGASHAHSDDAPHSGDAHAGGASYSDAVAIMNAWVREAHPDAAVNAGYMIMINVGGEDVTLTDVTSPAFDKVEIHEMAMVDGLMKMRELEEVVIPGSGGQARFEPGGTHLMLIGPRQHLTTGQTVELTLKFSSGQEQTITVKVANQ